MLLTFPVFRKKEYEIIYNIFLLFIPNINKAQVLERQHGFPLELMSKTLCLDYGESYFALLVYDNSSIFFNYGCQKYIEMINKPKVGIDTFLDRFEKKS